MPTPSSPPYPAKPPPLPASATPMTSEFDDVWGGGSPETTAASPILTGTNAFEATPPRGDGRFSLDGLWRSLSRLPHNHDGHVDSERKINHSARVLYAVITGNIPPSGPPKAKRLSLPTVPKLSGKSIISPTISVVSLATIAEPEVSEVKAKKGLKLTKKKNEASRPVPNVKPKALKKLKSDLLKADKARAIVADLKRMEVPPQHSPDHCVNSMHTKNCQGYALPCFPAAPPAAADSSGDTTFSPVVESAAGSASNPTSTAPPYAPIPPPTKDASSNPPFILLELPSSLPPTSVGGLGGLAAAKSGVFEILADASGALIKSSGTHDQLSFAPFDRISVFVWWWGFEIACPPPAMKFLSNVASVQQSFFQFLSIFVAAGGALWSRFLSQPRTNHSVSTGAPELAPLVRYISSYFDMEWSAIKAQNRGNGVVLAATWLLPVALVPRPWDFPIPSQPSPRPPPFPSPSFPLPNRPGSQTPHAANA
ncbi:hypothetical protein JCM11251_002116 [Rhodosporidiobolus azoricus]